MSRVVRRRCDSDPAAPSHDAGRSCEYEAYVPDRLIGRRFTLDGGVAAEVSEAEAVIAQLNIEVAALVDTEALARLLLRAECPHCGVLWQKVTAVWDGSHGYVVHLVDHRGRGHPATGARRGGDGH